MKPTAAGRAQVLSRRSFLRHGSYGVGLLGLNVLGGSAIAPVARAAGGGADDFGPLQPPDANGLMLPAGFTSRIVAVSNQLVAGTSHIWHIAPDGGATFSARDGGWVYVSNSERSGVKGGVGAIRFDAAGVVIDAYSILTGTARNCAGGPTPWGSWLSCEERAAGEVYECNPLAPGSQGQVRPALGAFRHEAAAVDPIHEDLYETEDETNGLFYRFTPDCYRSLAYGTLEAAEILDPLHAGPIAPGQVRRVAWHVVPDPTLIRSIPTRQQVPEATTFNGGEGCWYGHGRIYFSTKGSGRVWQLDTAKQTIEILYDAATSNNPLLTNVDNVYATSCGDVYVAEDPGDLQIVALTPRGGVVPIVRVTGVPGSEITGPALSFDGWRLYFSSQRNPGTTYEVTGPFSPPDSVPGVGTLGRSLLAAAIAAAGARLAGAQAAADAD